MRPITWSRSQATPEFSPEKMVFNHILANKHKLVRLVLMICFVLACTWNTSQSMADEPNFAVGDLVEFDFLGKPVQGKVTGFTGTGWPKVSFEHRGRTREHFRPAKHFKLIKSVSGEPAKPEQPPAVLREWTDATGKFKIQAKLMSNKDGQVQLEKEDGRVVSLPVDKLSEADKTYLTDLDKANDPANPFAGGVMKESSRTARRGRDDVAPDPNVAARSQPAVRPNLTLNERVLNAGEWRYIPAAGQQAPIDDRLISFSTSFTKHAFHNRAQGAKFSSDKRFLAIAQSNPFDKKTEVIQVNLETGFAGPPSIIGQKDLKMAAVSPGGDRFVTIKAQWGAKPGALDFWQTGQPAEHLASWTTAGFSDRNGFAPTKVKFVGDDQVVTVGRYLALWDVGSADAIYSIPLGRVTSTVFSPSANEVAVARGDKVDLIDVLTGDSLGQIAPPTDSTTAMAVSPGGQFLAGFSYNSQSIWIWDLENNELVQQLGGFGRAAGMHWVDERYMLVGDKLIDVELRVPIWQYTVVNGTLMSANNGQFWFKSKSKVVPIKLPHKSLDAQTAELDPDELLILKPGERIAFDFRLPFAPDVQATIRDKIAANLRDNGVQVDQSADLKLVATVKKLKQERVRMSDIRDPFGRFGGQDVNYTPHSGEVYLERNGQRFWSKAIRYGPSGVVTLKRGESAQQAVDRLSKPTSGFFASIRLPKYLATLPGGKLLGSSSINDSGVN